MTFTQLQTYLQQYLETNDDAVIGNIPKFMELATARISNDLRGSVMERTAELTFQNVIAPFPNGFAPLPDGFLAARALYWNGVSIPYVAPTHTENVSPCYTIIDDAITMYPVPAATETLSLVYYAASNEEFSKQIPAVLLHCAAAEAEMYQGNYGDAQLEMRLYKEDVAAANAWDIQSGPISLGGVR